MRIIFALTACLTFISTFHAVEAGAQAVENPLEQKREYSKLTRAHLELLVSLLAQELPPSTKTDDITTHLREKHSDKSSAGYVEFTVVKKANSHNFFITSEIEAVNQGSFGHLVEPISSVKKVREETDTEFQRQKKGVVA